MRQRGHSISRSGFSETGARPKYYATPDGREDAILMTLTLNHGGSAT
jgi:hypothetical protein